MADDKTAAEYEAARTSLRTLAESIRNGLPTFPDDARMLYDIADMLAAIRRAAPDRETLAEIIWRSDLDYTPDLDAWSKLTESHRDEYRANADAVLAVLVPADQVRADTLDEAARMLGSELVPLTNRQPDWRNAERELVAAARTYRQRVPS